MIIGTKIEEATDKFSRALGVDLDIALKRNKINEELRKLSNLSRIERYKAMLAIACDHEVRGNFVELHLNLHQILKTLLALFLLVYQRSAIGCLIIFLVHIELAKAGAVLLLFLHKL